MRFSIVVPVYKVEKYLDECVKSLLNQTYTDFEIILVDDKSPDNCPKMCDGYAQSDSRVRVIHKPKNEGLGFARNTVIEAALGDYVMFVDSDDTIDSKTLEKCSAHLDDKPDILVYGIKLCYENKKGVTVRTESLVPENFCAATRNEMVEMFYCLSDTRVFQYACNKAYRREFIQKLSVRFEETKLIEDFLYNINVFEYAMLYILFFASTFINALLPDFLYRGIEKMSAITVRTVSVKAFFTVAIFVFLKSPSDYYIVPLFNTLGAVGACIWTYFDVYKRINIRFIAVDVKYILKTLKRSSGYFWSRIATSVYGATNSIIVGSVYPSGPVMGLYASADKLTSTARSAFSPIADSLYPYIVKNKDYKLVKKVLVFLMPIIILGCAVVFIFAEPFCVLLFGKDFVGSAPYLRFLLPIVAISLPNYIFGFPVLSPLGLAKYANVSVIIGAICHLLQLSILYFTGALNVKTICIATCITEFIILSIRVAVVIKSSKRLKSVD